MEIPSDAATCGPGIRGPTPRGPKGRVQVAAQPPRGCAGGGPNCLTHLSRPACSGFVDTPRVKRPAGASAGATPLPLPVLDAHLVENLVVAVEDRGRCRVRVAEDAFEGRVHSRLESEDGAV